MIGKFFYLFLLILFYTGIAGAHSTNVTGHVTDINGKPISFANAILLKADSTTLVKASYTDDNGNFDIEAVSAGQYVLKVTLVGFNTYTLGNLSLSDNNVKLPDIVLEPKSGMLEEVAVRTQKPFIEVKADKIVVNVENSIVSAGASALEVLSRSPGVTVDQNDNISLKGKQGVNIMINGKIQPINMNDLATILKNTPANAIEKIEIISNPSSKYDAQGTAGIINIIMKKDQRLGMNGSVNGSYGQGVYPKANGGINLNYRNKKINIYGSYNYAYREGFNRLTLIRHFYNNGLYDGAYQQDHFLKFPAQSHRASAGLDYSLNAKTTVGLSVSGGATDYSTSGGMRSQALDAIDIEKVDSFFTTNNSAHNKWNDYAVNANLKHTFDGTGKELTIDADYARYWNKNIQTLTTSYFTPDGLVAHNPYILYGDISGLTQIRSFKADYSEPIKNARIEAGIKTSFVTADNQPMFYDESNGGQVYDAGKSDHYLYNENINAAYVNGSENIGKWSMQLGLRMEQSNIKGDEKITNQKSDTSYLQLFPSIFVQRHVNKDNDLSLSISRRVERPNYQQLNPYKFYSDPTTYKEGYPYLRPAFTYAAELSHTYRQRFITTLSYSVTHDVITEVLLPGPDRVTIQTERNIATMKYFGLSCSYTFQFAKWWSNITNANAYYSYYEGDLANTTLSSGKPTFDINTVNNFLLPKEWSAELSFFYQAPQLYGYMHLAEMWMLNVGVQKNILNKRAIIRLNATDILWHGNPEGASYYSNYDEAFAVKRDSRQVNISFTYRFGKNTVAPVRRRAGGAEEEMKRAANTGNG
ncbi:MAG: outer membrane beta-barrel protein [Flavipsychrobacter sp.]